MQEARTADNQLILALTVWMTKTLERSLTAFLFIISPAVSGSLQSVVLG
jgi:hypothetical protein